MIKKAVTYLQNVRTEMGKVSWPTREQVIESTAITLVVSTMIALFVFGADMVISWVINIIL